MGIAETQSLSALANFPGANTKNNTVPVAKLQSRFERATTGRRLRNPGKLFEVPAAPQSFPTSQKECSTSIHPRPKKTYPKFSRERISGLRNPFQNTRYRLHGPNLTGGALLTHLRATQSVPEHKISRAWTKFHRRNTCNFERATQSVPEHKISLA
ncbi:hypothetical protein B0H19DRAFT_1264775 [Mycena capillaripes]|nr:hypothetical protein B0H19DRAFT_1264775 [Mycena capillaripes]